jgi:hypothetical protein
MIKKVSNYSGPEYREFEILEREQIEEIIAGLSDYEIVRAAMAGHIDGMKSGYAVLSLETGKLGTESLGQGEQQHPWSDVQIYLYKLDQNTCMEVEDVLDDEEQKEFEEFSENGLKSLKEFAQEKSIDIDDRYEDALVYYRENILDQEEGNIREQLDRWYSEC